MEIYSNERSRNMAAIRSSGTKMELLLGKSLWARGHRYRKNNKTVFGKPDFTFKKYKIAIFVDSEFFHGKDFETKKKPVNNAEFWDKKIKRNIQRDIEVNIFLKNEGWTVLRFWSNEIKKNLPVVIASIGEAIDLKKSVSKNYTQEVDNLPLAAEPDEDK